MEGHQDGARARDCNAQDRDRRQLGCAVRRAVRRPHAGARRALCQRRVAGPAGARRRARVQPSPAAAGRRRADAARLCDVHRTPGLSDAGAVDAAIPCRPRLSADCRCRAAAGRHGLQLLRRRFVDGRRRPAGPHPRQGRAIRRRAGQGDVRPGGRASGRQIADATKVQLAAFLAWAKDSRILVVGILPPAYDD